MLIASQNGDTEYSPAAQETMTFYVKKDQIINFTTIAPVTFSANPIPLDGSATSGLPVLFKVLEGAVNLNNNSLFAIASGSVTIQATQSGNDHYFSATEVAQTFCVNPSMPFIELTGDALKSSSKNGNQWFREGILIANATKQSILQMQEFTQYRYLQENVNPHFPKAL